jgi:hypothetical protein
LSATLSFVAVFASSITIQHSALINVASWILSWMCCLISFAIF